VGSQAAEPLPGRGPGTSQSRHGEQTGTIGQILPPGRDLAAARSPGTEAGSVIWRTDPIAIGRRQVTVTECTKQTVTNWLRYAHIAEYALVTQ
jgi:hypothetical protein